MKLMVVSALTAPMVTSVARSADRLTPDGFVMKASEAGTAEVELGRLAAQKSSSPEVQPFDESMVADHTEAGAELQAIARKMAGKLGAGHAAP